jgi:hypothetical protein
MFGRSRFPGKSSSSSDRFMEISRLWTRPVRLNQRVVKAHAPVQKRSAVKSEMPKPKASFPGAALGGRMDFDRYQIFVSSKRHRRFTASSPLIAWNSEDFKLMDNFIATNLERQATGGNYQRMRKTAGERLWPSGLLGFRSNGFFLLLVGESCESRS